MRSLLEKVFLREKINVIKLISNLRLGLIFVFYTKSKQIKKKFHAVVLLNRIILFIEKRNSYLFIFSF